MLSAAATEMQTIFKTATGVTLPIVKASQAVYTDSSTYISLGYNAYANESGYDTVNTSLGTDGYEICKKGLSVYILGQDYGTLYGVYGLMEELVEYEYYYKDTQYIKQTNEILLTDVTERAVVPDIANRAGGYGTMWAENDVYNPNRWGVKIYTNYFAFVNGSVFHNAFSYLPTDTYRTTHPKWYAISKGWITTTKLDQLCYTAQGDATEYALMVNAVVEVLKTVVKNNPNAKYVSLSGMDNDDVCACSTCKEKKNYYGSDAGAYILFVNDVDKAFREWLNSQTEVKTDVSINVMAYLGYLNAPTKNISELTLRDGVSVTIAPIEISYAKDFTDATKTNFNNWAKLTNRLGFWLYDKTFGTTGDGISAGIVPYYSENGMQARYQYLKSIGAEYVFVEGGSSTYGYQMSFSVLKMYLNSELAWNANADVDKLIDGFFTNMYGLGANDMRLYYDALTAHMADMVNRGVSSTPFSSWGDKAYWSKAKLLGFQGYINDALSAISSLEQTNESLYKKLHMHIVAERITINYMLIKLYGSSLSNVDELKAELLSDIIETGLQSGSTKGEDLYNSLMG